MSLSSIKEENKSSVNADALDYIYENYNINIDEAGGIGVNAAKATKRHSKHIIAKDDVDYILSIDHLKACEKSTIMELFGDFGDGTRFNPYDTIEIPSGSFGGISTESYSKKMGLDIKDNSSSKKKNKNKFTTTIGLWIFNKSFIEPMSDILGYINKPITGKVYDDINQKVSYALIEDKITVRQLKNFIMQSQIIMSCCSAISPSHTELIFEMEEKISKKKAELEKELGDKLEAADLVVAKEYEDAIIDYAKEILKDDEAVDMFNSSARSNWGNNFKNMYGTRGPVKGTDGKYKVIRNSYIEGLSQADFVAVADASIYGPYNRAVLTSAGGYLERQLTGCVSHIKILGAGSDCGTDKYITVELTKNNVKDWMYSFIIDNDNLVELTNDNKDKYIGKVVKFRYSMLCKAKDGICEKCAGTMFNRIGIANVGVAGSILGSALKNTLMKAFHDGTVSLAYIDVKKSFN